MQNAATASAINAQTAANTSGHPLLDGGGNGTSSVDGPSTFTSAPQRQYSHVRDGPSPAAVNNEHILQLIEQNRELSGIAVGMMDQYVQVYTVFELLELT